MSALKIGSKSNIPRTWRRLKRLWPIAVCQTPTCGAHFSQKKSGHLYCRNCWSWSLELNAQHTHATAFRELCGGGNNP